MKKLPRTIRLDETDTRVFEQAAEPGEWAVSGAFIFADDTAETLVGKRRQAFANGFLGTASFGWSTFAVISEIDLAAYEAVVETLAARFVADFGAPDMDAARAVAQEEVAFAAGLCEHRVNSLLRVERDLEDDGIVERFGIVEPSKADLHAPVWEIVDDDDAGG